MFINQLHIFTPNLLDQRKFYSEVLKLPVVDESPTTVSFQVGRSTLKIEEKEGSTPYHFAFNIPSTMEYEAYEWLRQRVNILTDGEKVIQDFDNWNAKAVYFYDADNNIVEFIARRNLKIPVAPFFDAMRIVEISEVGIPTENLPALLDKIKSSINLEEYDGGPKRFCALGDEHGLFICIDKTIKDWFPTNDKAFASAFGVKIETEKGAYEVLYARDELTVRALLQN